MRPFPEGTCGVVVDPEDDLEVEPDPQLMAQVSDILSALTSFNRDARALVFNVCETLPIPGIGVCNLCVLFSSFFCNCYCY